jgi:hypothetical protein
VIRFTDGSAYCDFLGSQYKYNTLNWAGSNPCSDWFSGSPGTLTGLIDAGPFASTYGITFQQATGTPDFFGNTGWHQVAQLGTSSSNIWILSMWVKPENITSRQTFFAFLGATGPPNETGVLALHLNGNNYLELNTVGSNVRMNTIHGDLAATSINQIPNGQWTHLCIYGNFVTRALGGRIKLWVNGSLDTDVAVPVAFAGASAPVNQAGLLWQNTGAAQITLSQIVVADGLGAVNNSQFFPSTQIATAFPIGDVSTGWTPSSGSQGYLMVNENPGPDGDSTYISLPSLSFPEELFSFPATSSGGIILGVAGNVCVKGASQTLQALQKRAGVSNVLGNVLTAPAAYQTQQGIADVDPATLEAWTDAHINASSWGVRGLTGINERVSQYYLEKVWATPLGSYSY